MRYNLKTIEKKHLFWLIPLLIIFYPIVIILSILEYFGSKKRAREARKYFEKHKDKYFFFYSNKKGWGDFVNNNVIPILPSDTYVFNIYEDKNHPLSIIYRIIDFYKISWTEAKLPFIIKFSSPTPKIMTFQTDFNILKMASKRDELIQIGLKTKIDEKIN
ncbi:MAG: hypothetical protein V4608_07335 [Bacteroidota bacterium]